MSLKIDHDSDGYQIRLLDLPPELLLQIFQSLGASDICNLRETCACLRAVCDQEEVWRHLCIQNFGHVMAEQIKPSKILYQKILHRYGPLAGLWQRMDVRYRGGLVRVAVSSAGLQFQHLRLYSDCICGDVEAEQLLTVCLDEDEKVVVSVGGGGEAGDSVSRHEAASVLHLLAATELVVVIPPRLSQVLYCIYCTALCCTVLYCMCTVPYVLYCTVLYCAVLYRCLPSRGC